MNCKICGTPLQPEDRFCYECGAPVSPAEPATSPAESTATPAPAMPTSAAEPVVSPAALTTSPTASAVSPAESTTPPAEPIAIPVAPDLASTESTAANTSKKKTAWSGRTALGILCIVAGCLIVVGIFASLFQKVGYRGTLHALWQNVAADDTSSVITCMLPEEAGADALVSDSVDAYLADFQERVSRYGENYQVSVKVDEKEKLGDEELEQFNLWLDDFSLEEDAKKLYTVSYTRSVSGKNGKESERREGYLYRYDGDWYVLDAALLGVSDPLE